MITNDATILRLKHDVLYEVAKKGLGRNIGKERDEIPYEMIPGPQAQYRCCIYKEREIIKQRVRLAEGQCPIGHESKNVVQVINAACEECPIASYIVTDNCRKCMGKACRIPVILVRLPWGSTEPISTPINVKSAESAPRHVLTMQLHIWKDLARKHVR